MISIVAMVLASAQPIVGITIQAPVTISNAPATFELGGVRLGMSESELLAATKARGMVVRRATRLKDFEAQVRSLITTRGGRCGFL